MKLLPLSIALLLSTFTLSAQQDPPKPGDASARTTTPVSTSKDVPEATPDNDREEIVSLIRELETTIEELGKAHTQVGNVKKIVDTLDQGAVKATDKELVKTNQFVRQQLARDFRELRARARSVSTQVNTVLLPKQRGMDTKLQTRWDLETDAAIKPKIAKLLSEHREAMVETEEQLKRLEGNIQKIGVAIQILEGQLNYLELVDESLQLGRKVSEQLRDLNREIDKVVNTLLEKEIKQ